MSGSLTVIGGHTNSFVNGAVSVPSGFTVPVTSFLQSYLSVISGEVSANSINFYNDNLGGASGVQTVPAGSGATPASASGLLEITNTDSGAGAGSTPGIQLTVPSGYSSLVVQEPGTESITGNGTDNFVAVFGAQSSVNFTASSGSGSIFAAGSDTVLVGGTAWSIAGGTVGGNVFELLSNSAALGTEGGANTILAAGISDSIVSGGSNDLIIAVGGPGTSVTASVLGGSTFIGRDGAYTIDAIGGSVGGAIASGYGGTIDFINNSTVGSVLSGGNGALTVFGGAGGGLYIGGALGSNSMVGGTGDAIFIGSSGGNDTLIANGDSATSFYFGGMSNNVGSNLLIAGSQDATGAVTTGGNQYLASGASAGTTDFYLGAGLDQASAAGSGTQTFHLSALGSATITGSTAATSNVFTLKEASTGGGTSDVIANFRVGTDSFSVTGASITGVTANELFYNDTAGNPVTGSDVALSDGTHIKLIGVTLTNSQVSSIPGGSTF